MHLGFMSKFCNADFYFLNGIHFDVYFLNNFCNIFSTKLPKLVWGDVEITT